MKNIENVKYKILNPGGNKTAIVIGNDYTDCEKKIINDTILIQNLTIEQVGFISNKEKKLEMAGGEFCINATRCAIWEYLHGKPNTIELKVSGSKENIIGGITNKKEVYAKININKTIDDIMKTKGEFNFVELEGILLAVVNKENAEYYIGHLKENKEKTKLELKEIMKTFETNQKAVGIILLEDENKSIKINPIIWVKTIDTLYYETACGSGSLATAIYSYYTKKTKKLEIVQPSGYTININLDINNNYIKEAVVSGKILEEKGEMNYGRI